MQRTLRIIASMSVALAFIVLFNSLFIMDANLIKELPINLKTGSIIGIDVNNTALTFGRLPLGSGSSREIIISNNKNEPIKIVFKVEGEVKSLISFEQNPIELQPHETKKINVFATSPSNSENEEYTGTLKIYSYDA